MRSGAIPEKWPKLRPSQEYRDLGLGFRLIKRAHQDVSRSPAPPGCKKEACVQTVVGDNTRHGMSFRNQSSVLGLVTRSPFHSFFFIRPLRVGNSEGVGGWGDGIVGHVALVMQPIAVPVGLAAATAAAQRGGPGSRCTALQWRRLWAAHGAYRSRCTKRRSAR